MAKKSNCIARIELDTKWGDWFFEVTAKTDKKFNTPIIKMTGYSSQSNANRGYKRIISKLKIPAGVIELV